MNRQTKSRLKKHPFIRFIRGVIRLLRILFRPDRNSAREIQLERVEILTAHEPELTEQYITVGNLFDQVDWQFVVPLKIDPPINTKVNIRQHDVSLN